MLTIDLINPSIVTRQIELFRQFLVSSFPHLDKLMEFHDWDNDVDLTLDWIQVNWELLVERELLGRGKYLTPLSVPLPTRVTNGNIHPEYSIITQISKNISDLRTGKNLPKNSSLRLFGFCSAIENGYGIYPPFDIVNLVLDSTKELFIIPLSGLEFQVAFTAAGSC